MAVMTNDERVAHLHALRAVPPAEWPTRDRILYEAARLIAAKGYHGASTRDITEAVGIRQPSMFNHFASKQAILAELLALELSIPAARADELSRAEGRPVARLYQYMLWDFEWYGEMPLDLRGMQEELLDEPGLEAFRADLETWKKAINRIVRQGVAAGEFEKDAVGMVTTVLTGLSWEIVRTAQLARDPRTAAKQRKGAALFVLRALVTDPRDIAAVVDAADDTPRRTATAR